jgi:hypothetical protein
MIRAFNLIRNVRLHSSKELKGPTDAMVSGSNVLAAQEQGDLITGSSTGDFDTILGKLALASFVANPSM